MRPRHHHGVVAVRPGPGGSGTVTGAVAHGQCRGYPTGDCSRANVVPGGSEPPLHLSDHGRGRDPE